MGNFFVFAYNFFEKRRLLLFLLTALSLTAGGYLAARLTLEEDISKALPAGTGKFNEYLRNGKFLDKIVLTISQKDTSGEADPDLLTAYAEAFVLEADSNLRPFLADIQYKVDDEAAMRLIDHMHAYLPLFLDSSDYRQMETSTTREGIRGALEADLRTLASPAGIPLKKNIARDPLGFTWMGMRKVRAFQFDEQYELYDGYVMTRDGRNLLVFLLPAAAPTETKQNRRLVEGLDSVLARLERQADFTGVQARYFGATPVSVANAVQLRSDTIVTLSITVVMLLLVSWWFFRRKRVPFMLMIPVLAGVLFALAGIYLLQGSISMIAVGTGSVVLGIALNYAIHFFSHLRHEPDIRQTIRELAEPMTIGSATTVGAFLCLQWVNSEILRDLGLFAGLTLIGTALFTLLVLPHLIAIGNKNAPRPPKTALDRLSDLNPEKNKYLVIALLALTPFMFYYATKTEFDSNLEHLNFMPPKLKTAQDELNRMNTFAMQSIYAVSEGKNLDEALRKSEQIGPALLDMKERGQVRKFTDVSALLQSDSLQRARIRAWEAFWTSERKAQVLADISREGAALKFKASAFDGFKSLLDAEFKPLPVDSAAYFKKNFLADYIDEKPGRCTVVTLIKAEPKHRDAVYATLEQHPETTAFDRQLLARQFMGMVQDDFNDIALYSSLLVFLALLLAYGRIELTVISFLPMVVTWIWILGLMHLLGISFNIVNVILSALIFGLGDDFAIFVMDGLQQEYRTGKKTLPSIRAAIFMSAITTIIGLGVLILAKHPAVRSLSVISVVGILCVVFVSQTLEPFLFNLLIGNRVRAKKPPYTAFKLVKSVVGFAYFIFGSLLLTALGVFFIKLAPFAKKQFRYAYHWTLSKFTGSLIFLMANVKKRIINPRGEDFSKPAVIVCNHQSMLDILSITMLHPKLLLLTNKWVWDSPVFGQVVRMADYYPVGEGYDNIDRLADRIAEGYSVVVFPEGTRSPDGDIKRFHKGAFYLAEQFKLDILPLVIHGTGNCMTKGDFMLKDGQITLKFLPRITPEDTRFGEGYAERAKLVGRYFRSEFAELCTEIEKPAYFREKLFSNYLFKGPVLEWYMRIKVALENNYTLFHELLPSRGAIVDIGCGYGFMSYMLHYLSPERDITGLDYDEEKVAVANHNWSRDAGIRFEHADINTYELPEADGFILADVLHYLQPAEQQAVLRKCLSKLRKGGVMVVRDGNKDLKERHRGTWLTEFFSTRVLGFNKTAEQGLSFLSASDVQSVAAEFGMECTIYDPSKMTSNIVLVIRN